MGTNTFVTIIIICMSILVGNTGYYWGYSKGQDVGYKEGYLEGYNNGFQNMCVFTDAGLGGVVCNTTDSKSTDEYESNHYHGGMGVAGFCISCIVAYLGGKYIQG